VTLIAKRSSGYQPRTRIGRGLSRLRVRDWAWVQVKIVVGIGWPVQLLIHPPAGPARALGGALSTVAIVTILGALVSLFGLIAARQRGGIAVVGLTIETVGIGFVLAGLIAYWLTQVALLSGPDGEQRQALAWYAYGMAAAIAARLAIVLTERHEAAVRPERRIA
jgi:hypothetical protein